MARKVAPVPSPDAAADSSFSGIPHNHTGPMSLPESAAPNAPAPLQRVGSVDLLRGAVMVVMALDHTRDYFLILPFQPEDLAQSNLPLFLTRWITHFCAPVFFLLAGTGTGFALMRGRTPAQASRFLFTRGLWLVVLELTVVAIAWNFNFKLFPAVGLVIWALGWSMVALAVLIRLPRTLMISVSVAMIVLHNLTDGVTAASVGQWGPLWTVLHVQETATPWLFAGYPLIPWIGVMALGYALADVYRWDAPRRRRFLLRLGTVVTLAFIVIRAINLYGDPEAWTTQRNFGLTIASFLNTWKYPPSLDYLLMTLGPMLIVLALLERAQGTFARWITVFGRVPMFYYILHLYLIHSLAIVLGLLQGGAKALEITPETGIPAWYGLPLYGTYLVWALVIVILYFPCRWFAAVKARRRDWWLSYI